MNNIALVAGAKYRLRNDYIIGPLEHNTNNKDFPFKANDPREKMAGNLWTWTESGLFNPPGDSILDIVELVEMPFTVVEPTVTLFSEIPLSVYREAVAKRFDGDCIRV